MRLQGRWRAVLASKAERRDLEEKLWLAEQRETYEAQAKAAEEAKVGMGHLTS